MLRKHQHKNNTNYRLRKFSRCRWEGNAWVVGDPMLTREKPMSFLLLALTEHIQSRQWQVITPLSNFSNTRRISRPVGLLNFRELRDGRMEGGISTRDACLSCLWGLGHMARAYCIATLWLDGVLSQCNFKPEEQANNQFPFSKRSFQTTMSKAPTPELKKYAYWSWK